MTNQDLLNRRHVLQLAQQHVTTSRFKYAIQKNLRRVQSELTAYEDTLKGLIKEHEVALTDDGRVPPDAPDAFIEDVDELLGADAGEVDVHTIDDAIFDREDDRGADIPFGVIGALDFMIRPVTPTHSDTDADA